MRSVRSRRSVGRRRWPLRVLLPAVAAAAAAGVPAAAAQAAGVGARAPERAGGAALVCLGGRLSDLSRTADSFVEQLLGPFVREGVHVEVLAPHADDSESLVGIAELQRLASARGLDGHWRLHAKKIGRRAGLLAAARRTLEAHTTFLRFPAHGPGGPQGHGLFEARRLLSQRLQGTWLGSLVANSSTAGQEEVVDDALFGYLQQEVCLRRYRQREKDEPSLRLLYTQASIFWHCPHPPLRLLADFYMHVPDALWDDVQGPDTGDGLYTGHAVLTAAKAQAYLGGWRWLFSEEAVYIDLYELWGPEVFLRARLEADGQDPRIHRLPPCGHRVCADVFVGRDEWSGPRCDLRTSARYPWEATAARTTAECFVTSIAANNLVDWTREALQDCFLADVPFPEDAGVNYPVAEVSSPEMHDTRRCLRAFHENFDQLTELYGALLDQFPQDAEFRMHKEREHRHRCRSFGMRYLHTHASNSVGICLPRSCPIEAVPHVGIRYTLLNEFAGTNLLGADVNASQVLDLAASGFLFLRVPTVVAIEDPYTGLSMGAIEGRKGQTPCWSVQLSAVNGVDFVIAGFPRAGTTTIYANLERHPEITFTNASSGQHEDALFMQGYSPCVSARDRRLLRGEGSRRRRMVGVYDSNLLTSDHSIRALRSVHRRRPVKLIVAVRHPIELLESNLNYVPPQVTEGVVRSPEMFLEAEFIRAGLLPWFSEEDLLLVPLSALSTRPRAAMNRICRFLGIGPLPVEQRILHGNARPRGPWSISLQGPRLPERLSDLLFAYYSDDAAALRLLVKRFGGWEGFGPLLPGPPCPEIGREEEELQCFVEKRLRSETCMGIDSLHLPQIRRPELPQPGDPDVGKAECCEKFKILHLGLVQQLVAHTCRSSSPKPLTSCGWWRFGWVPEEHLGHRPLVALAEAGAAAHPRSAQQEPYAVLTAGHSKDGDIRRDEEVMLGAAQHGILETHGSEQAQTCLSKGGRSLGECLLRVRVKDPWGCFRHLRPRWARAIAWVHCCGGAGLIYARLIMVPCPSVQCCLSRPLTNRSKKAVEESRALVLGKNPSPVPSWLTCAEAPDERWHGFKKLLMDHRLELTDPKLRESAMELVASKETDEQRQALASLLNAHKEWGYGPDPGFCFAGYACALYVTALGDDNKKEREWHRWQLIQLLNVGEQWQPDLTPLAWFLDIGGWPIPAVELVNFALEGPPGPLPGSVPLLELPALTTDAASLPPLQNRGAQPPSGVLLISSHLFALDIGFAMAAALGAASGRAPSLRWHGFPDKFHRKNFGHVVRICSTALPRVTCGGRGAKALDRLLELLSIGRFVPPESKRQVRNSKLWPFTLLQDPLWIGSFSLPASPENKDAPYVDVRMARLGGVSWSSLVNELGALMRGDLTEGHAGEVVVCGYPSVMCIALDEALRRAGRRLMVMALSGTPVEYAEPELQGALWQRLHDMNTQPDRALLSVSHFDEAHYWVASGLRVPRLAFGARYIAAAVAPEAIEAAAARLAEGAEASGPLQAVLLPPAVANQESRQILVSKFKLPLGGLGTELMWQLMDDLCVGHLCPYRFISFEVWVDWDILNDYRAGVFFPWNWELITFLEWYGLGIPVFVPGPSWAVPLILHTLTSATSIKGNGTGWVNLRPEWAFGVEDAAKLELTAESIAVWWARTDYVRLPYMRTFDHIGDLVRQVGGCDFDAWTATLRAENARRHRAAAAWYSQLAARAVGVGGPPDAAGPLSSAGLTVGMA